MTFRRGGSRPSQLHGDRVASTLRAYADRADQGEVVGVALAVRTAELQTELTVVGVYERAPEVAHYAVSKLKDVLLYPDEQE